MASVAESPGSGVSSVRIVPPADVVASNLGLLADLAGTWQGEGFNLIARPNFQGNTPLYLQLSQTQETLVVTPIGSAIPNRGFGQDDIELFGLTYLQKIADAHTGGALHIEPGIWVTQPETTYPNESPPPDGQIVARMGNIPHGNSILLQGAATPFTDPPTLPAGGSEYAGSIFPSFNSTPFGVGPTGFGTVAAAGSSEQQNAAALGKPPFQEYDVSIAASSTNPRTPFGTTDPPLPSSIDGVAMQDIINDPIKILQAIVQDQVGRGITFRGVALNVASAQEVVFAPTPNDPTGPTQTVTVPNGGGGAENILFLEGGQPTGAQGPNALTSLVYATFWIEELSHDPGPGPDDGPLFNPPGNHFSGNGAQGGNPQGGNPAAGTGQTGNVQGDGQNWGPGTFLQLQYAQMTVLNFGILGAAGAPILGWPHITVGTLRKSFS